MQFARDPPPFFVLSLQEPAGQISRFFRSPPDLTRPRACFSVKCTSPNAVFCLGLHKSIQLPLHPLITNMRDHTIFGAPAHRRPPTVGRSVQISGTLTLV